MAKVPRKVLDPDFDPSKEVDQILVKSHVRKRRSRPSKSSGKSSVKIKPDTPSASWEKKAELVSAVELQEMFTDLEQLQRQLNEQGWSVELKCDAQSLYLQVRP